MNSKISKSILQKIAREKIAPHSRWFFLLGNALILFGGIIFFIFGIVATSIIFHFWNHLEFAEFLLESPKVLIKILTFGVPLFWIIFAIILGTFANLMARKSPRGYKVPIVLGVSSLLFLQIASGFFLEKSNIGDHVDAMMEERISFYRGAEKMRNRMWKSVEDGFLAGEIIEIKSDKIFLLDDANEKEWEVKCDECYKNHRVDKILKVGKKVKMVGEQTGENKFSAKMARPFKRPFLPPPSRMEDGRRPNHQMMDKKPPRGGFEGERPFRRESENNNQ